MENRVITLTTDFGYASPYVASMKGVILSINPSATIIDITHGVPPQDIRQGAIALEEATGLFPTGSIHLAVVDPLVGTRRDVVVAQISGQHFVAPDCGLLSLVARSDRIESVFTVSERRFWRSAVSQTFHGRDIMAPVAAHLSLSVPPEEFGPPHPRLVELHWEQAVVGLRRIVGKVRSIDTFGNLITNIAAGDLLGIPADSDVAIEYLGQVIRGISRTYADHADGELIALVGSNNRLELAVTSGSAHVTFGGEVGTGVVITW